MTTHSLLQDALPVPHRPSGVRGAARERSAAVDDDRESASTAASAADSDDALVRRAQAGERDALVLVYRRYVNEVFGFAYHQLGDAQDAEDVTSETFLRLVSALDAFDHRASIRTWLYAVARNQLRDRWRQRGRRPIEADLDDAAHVPSMAAGASFDDADRYDDAEAERADDHDLIVGSVHAIDPASDIDPMSRMPLAAIGRQVMAALPEHYRTVLTLRVAEGRSIRDVAEAMGTTPGNVKVLQHRALKRAAALAAALEAAGAPERAPERS